MIPNSPVQAFEYVDVIVFVTLTIILGYLLWEHKKKRGNLLSTISATVAATSHTSLMFSLAMSIMYPLYYAWLWVWVGPRYGAPDVYYVLLGASAVFELIFVWVPASAGWKKKVHEMSAGVVAIAMLIFPAIVLSGAAPAGTVAIGLFYIATIVMAGMLLVAPNCRKHTLIYEIVFCAAFLLALSTVGHS